MNPTATRPDVGGLDRFLARLPDSPATALPSSTHTPLQCISHESLGTVYLKREDLQPCGSHKERAAWFQLSRMVQQHDRGAVIPSSGNAGIAVSHYCRLAHLPAIVFLTHGTHSGKVAAILNEGGNAILCDKPVNYARFASRVFDLPNLRPSTDSHAITGFMTLGYELMEQLPTDFSGPVFMFSTSGASLLGMITAFQTMPRSDNARSFRPRPIAVQSGRAHALASHFDPRPFMPRDCLAGTGGLSDSELTPDLKAAISKLSGSALYCSDNEILAAHALQTDLGLSVSHETDASLAALMRYRQTQNDPACLIVTGAERTQIASEDHPCRFHASSYNDVRTIIEHILMERT